LASISTGIDTMWSNREKCGAWTIVDTTQYDATQYKSLLCTEKGSSYVYVESLV